MARLSGRLGLTGVSGAPASLSTSAPPPAASSTPRSSLLQPVADVRRLGVQRVELGRQVPLQRLALEDQPGAVAAGRDLVVDVGERLADAGYLRLGLTQQGQELGLGRGQALAVDVLAQLDVGVGVDVDQRGRVHRVSGHQRELDHAGGGVAVLLLDRHDVDVEHLALGQRAVVGGRHREAHAGRVEEGELAGGLAVEVAGAVGAEDHGDGVVDPGGEHLGPHPILGLGDQRVGDGDAHEHDRREDDQPPPAGDHPQVGPKVRLLQLLIHEGKDRTTERLVDLFRLR